MADRLIVPDDDEIVLEDDEQGPWITLAVGRVDPPAADPQPE